MKNGPGLLIALFLALIAFTIWFRFDQYIVKSNYLMIANAVCDPSHQECFAYDCDPSDSECDPTPYQKITIRANEAPLCLKEHSCSTFSCEGIDSCEAEVCSEETLAEGEVCVIYEPPQENTLIEDEVISTEVAGESLTEEEDLENEDQI